MKIYIPIRIESAANTREHWRKKHARDKKQAAIVRLFLKNQVFPLPCIVTLTRISPRRLDVDNLMFGLKAIRDAVSDLIIPGLAKGRADGDNRIGWCYKQENRAPKEYALEIEIEEK
jgi:hypothetical protein